MIIYKETVFQIKEGYNLFKKSVPRTHTYKWMYIFLEEMHIYFSSSCINWKWIVAVGVAGVLQSTNTKVVLSQNREGGT